MTTAPGPRSAGLSLAPMHAVRPTFDGARLGRALCPPYDVIDDAERTRLLAGDPDNAVAVVLPEAADGGDRYVHAAAVLATWVSNGRYAVDRARALYVYEMREPGGTTTRGLLGAVELRDPADGVILPHENTMAGPVADRLALMSATEADIEPIYLVYDGGGAATDAVGSVSDDPVLAEAITPDGITHRLWALTDPQTHRAIDDDLSRRRAMIADGHHRYATYRELQARLRAERGPGPWDYGLALLVDTSNYGPSVHAIHRVLVGLALSTAIQRLGGLARVTDVPSPADGLRQAGERPGFAAVLTDGTRSVLVDDPDARLIAASTREGEPPALAELDVTLVHRGLVEQAWGLSDDVATVGYAHSIAEAVTDARHSGGTALLLRPTPVAAVAAVAAAGARMPRKSTLFTPKPASGLVFRRFADER